MSKPSSKLKKKKEKSSAHSVLTFLIKLQKSIAGIILPKQCNATVVLAHCCQGQGGFATTYFQHILLSLSLGLSHGYIFTDSTSVSLCHFLFLWPLISNHNWIHTLNYMNYDFVLVQRQLNAQILCGGAWQKHKSTPSTPTTTKPFWDHL